ncbi:MAG: glycosyltransferase 87 family protein [Chloroflexota bacterium]
MQLSTPNRSYKTWKLAGYALSAVLLLVVLVIGVSFFERWPIENTTLAIDWQSIWPGLHARQYMLGLRIAPWDLLIMLPLGLFSLRTSWGIITLFTMGVLIVSVPRRRPRWRHWVSVLLLVISFPALRHTADGNFEGLVIAGALLLVYGYRVQKPWILALGILLVTAKVQEAWLLLGILALYILTTWPVPKQIRLGAILAAVVLLCWLWIGPAWLNAMFVISERSSIMDSSLMAGLTRAGASTLLVGICWLLVLGVTLYFCLRSQRTLNREKAAMLIAVSLLLSPYAAGNSFLTILAIGIIPTFLARPRLGLLLLVLTDLPFFLPHDFMYWNSAYYWTGMLLLVWAIWLWQIYRIQAQSPVVDKPLLVPVDN